MLIAMAGSQGTGKTTISKSIAERLPGLRLDKDEIRAAIFPTSEIDYTSAQNELATKVMFMVAEYIIKRDSTKHMILDGKPFSKRHQVDTAANYARQLGVALKIILCICPDEIVRTRLELDRINQAHIAAVDRSFDKYMAIKNNFEPIQLPHLVLDTSRSIEETIKSAMEYLYET